MIRTEDPILRELLEAHRAAGLADRRYLNRMIWRRRRWIRRCRARAALRDSAVSGRFPSAQPKNVTINWSKLCSERNPVEVLTTYYQDIYSLEESLRSSELERKTYHVESWRSLRIDILPYRISLERMEAALSKLKNGKGSPDGCTAELFKALPKDAVLKLCTFFTQMFASLEFPDDWSVVGATLIPKVVAASSLNNFRAIACLPVARKLLGYLWLQMFSGLCFTSFQCGFVAGSHAANGVYVVKRAAELSREWGVKLYAAQLDLKKAFDRVLHSAVLEAVRLQGGSVQCRAVLSALLQRCKTAVTLGHISADLVDVLRGLPQGAPESPLLFVCVVEMVLRPLLAKWKADGRGWSFSGLHLAAVCYADDIILLSNNKRDLERMIAEVVEGFLQVGLTVSTEKCHWTSYPVKKREKLRFGDDRIGWEPSLTFVGTIIDFNGNDRLAMEHRLAQGMKVFHKWKSVLQCHAAPVNARLQLLTKTVFMTVLWLSETWHLTKTQRQKLSSWGARLAGRTMCLRPGPTEERGDFWRRLYRTGHDQLAKMGGGLDARRRRKLHAFAGHAARKNDGLVSKSLRTRCLAWWRHFQQHGLIRHKKRFNAWRWEAQMADFYGEASSLFVDESVGWMAAAQDRHSWKSKEDAFASYC